MDHDPVAAGQPEAEQPAGEVVCAGVEFGVAEPDPVTDDRGARAVLGGRAPQQLAERLVRPVAGRAVPGGFLGGHGTHPGSMRIILSWWAGVVDYA